MFAKYVQSALAKLPTGENSVAVLKGIPNDLAEDLDAAAANPLKYFNAAVSAGRKIFTYEEFLLLKDFLAAQFDEIFVLNNNLYISQYPIESKFSAGTLANLLEHFREPEIEQGRDFPLGKLEKIFTGFRERGGILVGAYNDETAAENFSIRFIDLFDAADSFSGNESVAQDFFELNDESDFVCLVRKIIFDAPLEIYISWQNYLGDKSELKAHLKILCKNFSAQTKIYLVPREEFYTPFQSQPENLAFLKKIWGYDSFRALTVYDLQRLSAAAKPMREISQEQIIADIFAQVELCKLGKRHRDIFVTAPTGAGKSLIFQFPAIWLAEKFRLFTIVISPLIGLMDDQVANLQKVYPAVETFHSGTPPLIRQQIVQKISAGEVNILYISPETLLARSDVEQLIGDRTLGLIVIDEAHIVTTWGKQFRPDYWYLGDHIRRLQKNHRERRGHAFVIATFTATMIFQGFENMYEETVDSLNLQNPIRYFGELRRGDIEIEIDRSPIKGGQSALHDILKFDDLQRAVLRANTFAEKTLIYFPEVRLVEKALAALENANLAGGVAVYHGQLDKKIRLENQRDFRSGKKFVMLATKAFGMGIDIDDIEIVLHYAPTGNVCDYVQEIGRAARKNNLHGVARYHYSKNDFKYINRLHILSTIKNQQLLDVAEKICSIYQKKRQSNLLLDAQNFAYIFDSYYGDDSDNISKVKIALLMLQRDFEFKRGFSPITVRPVPLYSIGLFEIDKWNRIFIQGKFGNCLRAFDAANDIFQVDLKTIWERGFPNYSFPKFKFLLYTGSPELNFKYSMQPVLSVSVEKKSCANKNLWKIFKSIIESCIWDKKYFTRSKIAQDFQEKADIPAYKAQEICDIVLASMNIYTQIKNSTIFATRFSSDFSYLFKSSTAYYFKWIDANFRAISEELRDGRFYLDIRDKSKVKSYIAALGIFEALGEISFNTTGGGDNQIYIHINQIRNLEYILRNRAKYRNHILEDIADRHRLSVEMLSYLYANDLTSAQIWDLLEKYFFGEYPDDVKKNYNAARHFTDI